MRSLLLCVHDVFSSRFAEVAVLKYRRQREKGNVQYVTMIPVIDVRVHLTRFPTPNPRDSFLDVKVT